MSYKRSFSRRISVPYRGSVNYTYPASEHGGSGTAYYQGTAYEDVSVNVYVDTNPFDESVGNTNDKVNLLTGAVVATEAAEVAAIELNSKKVAKTIVSGFFGLIRSDISQQVMELTKKIESLLLHLKELGSRCADKQRQMEVDYNRLANNYMKIFGDLNSELDHRIHELDKPAFMFRKDCVEQTDRMTSDDSISTVTVSASEESALQAQIQASYVKKRALDTISIANRYLLKQKATADTINMSMLASHVEGDRFVPVCYMETIQENDLHDRSVYQNAEYPVAEAPQLVEMLKNVSYSKGNEESVSRFFNQEVASYFNTPGDHEKRVREMVLKLYSENK